MHQIEVRLNIFTEIKKKEFIIADIYTHECSKVNFIIFFD